MSPIIAKASGADTTLKWRLGFNMGYYQANRYHANFYNGSEKNANKISMILKNQYQYQEIFTLLGATDTFILGGLPSRMNYQPAVCLGFNMIRHLNPHWDIFLRFNYTKLHASDQFTIEVDPNTFPTFPDIRLFPIYGTEERMLMDLGLNRYQKINMAYDWFMELGLNMSNIDVKENKIRFDNKEYSIVDIYGGLPFTPGLPLQQYPNEQGGIGFGVFAGGGVRINVNEHVGFEPGFNIYAASANLPGYNEVRAHAFAYVRLSMSWGIAIE
jgi:hypothetical protein